MKQTLRRYCLTLPIPLALALLPACKSSSDDTGQGGPGAGGGEVPTRFALAISDRDASSPGEEAYLMDLATGVVRDVTPTLPGTTGILRSSVALSPDGLFAGVTSGDASGTAYYSVLDLAAGTTRRLNVPAGVALRDGEDLGGTNPGSFLFAPDSSKLVLSLPFSSGAMYLADADGTDLVQLTSDTLYMEPERWLDGNRLLVTSYVENDAHERASVLDASTQILNPVSPTPGSASDVDLIQLSDDQSTLALALYYEGSKTGSFEHAFSVDLSTGTSFAFDLEQLDDETLRISDDGSLLAFVTSAAPGAGHRVAIGDTTNGVSTVISAPVTIPFPRVSWLEFVPTTSTFAYVAEHELENADALYVKRPGQAVTALPETLVEGTEIRYLALSTTGSQLALVLRTPGVDSQQLYLVDVSGALSLAPLSDPLVTRRVDEITFSEDGRWLLSQELDHTSYESVLRAYPTAGQATGPVTLGPGWSGELDLYGSAPARNPRLWLHNEGAELLYVAEDGGYGQEDLYFTDFADPGAGRLVTLGAIDSSANGRVSQVFVREVASTGAVK